MRVGSVSRESVNGTPRCDALSTKAYKSAGIILPPCGRCQPFVQFRPSPPPRDVAYSNRDCLLLADQHDQSLPSGHAGVEQVPLQHRVVLGQNRDYDGRVFGALALVDRRGVGRPQRIEFAEAVGDSAAVETGGEFASVGIDIVDVADVAVVDVFVVVVLDLHDLVAGGEGPTETLDLALAGGVQRRLKFDIQRAGSDATAVHRAQHLNVTDGIEAEAQGDARLHQFDDPRHGGFGIVRLHKIEVAVALGPGEVGNGAPVDLVRAGADPAVGGLAKDFGQAHDRHRAGSDDVGQDLTRADGGELVDVADDQQRGMVGDGPHQRLHQQDVDHGGLVDDQQIAFERVVAVPFEPAAFRVHLEQPVNGFGLEPGGFGHALGGTARRGTQQQAHALGGEDAQDRVDDGRLAYPGPAGDGCRCAWVGSPVCVGAVQTVTTLTL